ncbi:type VI secretion system tube protein Hcp [Verrucomicrobia bacterium]|nr:type VI secretion system tube protein Hcp [Verrucomicrobiota bacterium]
MLVDGIDGESVADGYAKQIEVIGMHLNMSNGSNLHSGGQGEPKLTSFQDLVVTKYLNKASAPLMLNCARGKVIPSVKLSVTQAGGETI